MSVLIPTKPYMVRAIHEWCVDNGLTPHLLVSVNSQTRVPLAYVKDGEIVLNVNYSATKDLHIDNDAIMFSARFGGVAQQIYVPMNAIRGIFARENSQGMFFEIPQVEDVLEENSLGSEDKKTTVSKSKPVLKVVK